MLEMLKTGKIDIRAPQGKTVRMVVTGDTCIRCGVGAEDILNGRSKDILSAVAPFLDDADLRVMQWEMVLTDSDTPIDKTGPNLKAPPYCVELATAGNIDVALTANNHLGDYGPEAAMETISHLRKAGLKTVGSGANLAAASQPLSIERAGFKIGIVNAAENEFGLATREKAGGNPLDLPDNLRVIRKAKAENDLVVMFLHGGNEHYPLPNPQMVNTCRAFADGGADAVICIHAHCPQGLEIYDGKPIVYCPGNFFFTTDSAPPEGFRWIGYLPKITFDASGATAIEILPCRHNRDPWRVERFSPDREKAFLEYLARISEPIGDPAELKRLHEIWSAKRGSLILSKLCSGEAWSWPEDLKDREQVKAVLALRNLLTCEAHHGILATTMRLVEEYRLEEALEGWHEIEALQSTAFLE